MSLNNFGIVSAGLYRSAQPDAEAWLSLHQLGVTAVIKLDADSEYPASKESLEAGSSVQIAKIEIDQWKPDIVAVKGAAQQIKDWLGNGLRVLVHCMHGRDRTGLIIGAYRLMFQGWPLERVEDERAAYGVVGIIALADHEISEVLEKIAQEATP